MTSHSHGSDGEILQPIRVLYLCGLEEDELSLKPRSLLLASDINLRMPRLDVRYTQQNGLLVGEKSAKVVFN